jgi:hypothetical protein
MELSLVVVSYSNIKNQGFSNYKSSLIKFEYDYIILGRGEKWKGFVESKIKTCYNHIKQLKTKNLVICITDVNDVLACDYPSNLLEKFKKFKKDIVFGMENNCLTGNCDNRHSKKIKKNKKRRYINGGFYIGYKHAILKLFEYIISLKINNDQIGLGKYAHYYDNIGFDTQSQLVLNINSFNKNKYKYHNNRITSTESNNNPVFIHNPGLLYINEIGQFIIPDKYIPYTFLSILYNTYRKCKKILLITGTCLIIIYLFLKIYT